MLCKATGVGIPDAINAFYDVGLAVYLCGVENERQLPTYQLRGSFSENTMVKGASKHRLNQGRDPNLCFHRNSTGNEIDLLYPLGPDALLPVEIMAGQTVTEDYFKSMCAYERFRANLDAGALVVYGGKEPQARSIAHVAPRMDFSKVLGRYDRT